MIKIGGKIVLFRYLFIKYGYKWWSENIFLRLFWWGKKDYYFILRFVGIGIFILMIEGFLKI